MIKATLDLVQFNCTNSDVIIRDPTRGGEILIQIQDDGVDLDTEVGTRGQVLILEYMAPRRDCRVNIQLSARSEVIKPEPVKKKAEVGRFQALMIRHPVVVTVIISVVIVCLLCVIALVVQYQYQKIKYMRWRRTKRSTSGISFSSNNPYVPVDEAADRNTLLSFCPEDKTQKIISKQKLLRILVRRFVKAQNQISNHISKKGRLVGKRSNSMNLIECRESSPPSPRIGNHLISGVEVKKALAEKSRRLKKGTYTNGIRSRPPAPSSTPKLSQKEKRFSRSMSDILSLLDLVSEKPGLMKKAESVQTATVTTTASVETVVQCEKPDLQISESDVNSRRSSNFGANRRRRLMDKRAKDRLNMRRMTRKKSAAGYFSSNSTLSGACEEEEESKALMKRSSTRRSDSQDTLKPTAGVSMSELSENSLDIELEYDLYDCDLNNVSALPGSHFAPAFYYDDDDEDLEATPTKEIIELTQLFPVTREKDVKLREMTSSRTSDLTSSVTSNDLTTMAANQLDSSCYYSDEIGEESFLMAKLKSSGNQPQKQLLNLTFDADINFVDDD